MVIEAMAKQVTTAIVRHRGRSWWLKVVMPFAPKWRVNE
jgi:hypothetical protein